MIYQPIAGPRIESVEERKNKIANRLNLVFCRLGQPFGFFQTVHHFFRIDHFLKK
jgi:hypothetical protein